MAIVKMKFIKATGSLEMLDDFLEACYSVGDFHPENTAAYLSPAMGFSPLIEDNSYAAKLQKIEELAGVLGVTLHSGTITPGDYADTDTSQYIDEFSSFLAEIHNDRKLLAEQRETSQSAIEQFSHFTSLDAPLDELFAGEFIKVRFGHLPKENYKKLFAYGDMPYMLFIPCSEDETNTWGVYFTPYNKSEEIDRIFSLLYFERLHIPGAAGTAQQIIENLEENIEILNNQIAKLDDKLSAYWSKNEEKIIQTYSRLKWYSDAFDLRRYAAARGKQFYYVVWVPSKNFGKLREKLESIKDINCEYEDAEKKQKLVPVKLKNNILFRPFEYFVNMYGLPAYGSADITPFVAITYTLIFGIMFGDAGQGMVLMLAGFLMWKLKGMPLGKILIPCGASSVFFGFLFGSFFGFEDFFDPVYKALGFASKPVSVMDSVNSVLIFSIGIGVLLVLISMAINVYSCIKLRHFGEAVFSNNGIAGILFYTSGVFAVLSIFGVKNLLPETVLITIATGSALMLFFKDLFIEVIDTGHLEKKSSVMDFLLQNVFEMLEYALSYLSNTVSFLRVGAFVLVHAGMMMVVFALANGKNMVVIVLGNILVIALEGLLTGIQALRLQFYEMFSRFLEGDGRPFVAAGPAVQDRKN
ncbi:MAG: V-type ATP synthase subunit I [Acutalibacteraceae bacterium]